MRASTTSPVHCNSWSWQRACIGGSLSALLSAAIALFMCQLRALTVLTSSALALHHVSGRGTCLKTPQEDQVAMDCMASAVFSTRHPSRCCFINALLQLLLKQLIRFSEAGRVMSAVYVYSQVHQPLTSVFVCPLVCLPLIVEGSLHGCELSRCLLLEQCY